MRIELRKDGLWITGGMLDLDCGPYDTKKEAESDMRGLVRFFKYGDKPGYATSDVRRKKTQKSK